MTLYTDNTHTPNFGAYEALYEYKQADGKLLGYVARYANKKFTPWTYFDEKWQRKWCHEGSKPIYKLEHLYLHADKPVLIVEGEKTANKAQELLPQFVVISWMGGANAAKKVNWLPLSASRVYLWPDNDKAGKKAMDDVYAVIVDIASEAMVVNIDGLGLPDKWDLGDFDCDPVIDLDTINITILDSKPKKRHLDPQSFPDLSEKYRPLNTTDNIEHLLQFYNIKIRYNLMTNYPEFHYPGKIFSSANEVDCQFVEISNLCVKHGVPKVDLDKHAIAISDRNRYHPAVEFIESKAWDGKCRIDEFINTVEAENPILARMLIYRWLLSVAAAAYADEGIAVDGMLVFQGKGGIGKTRWIERLFPSSHRSLVKSGEELIPDNKDSLMNSTQALVVELGELDGTFKKSHISGIKRHITKSEDFYRVPFGRAIRKVPRRTVYYGSVNPVHFLADETGNRRFWTVSVVSINYNHTVDTQQLFAQLKTLLDDGESFRLNKDEFNLLMQSNEDFESDSPLKEAIIARYRWSDGIKMELKTCRDVLIDCGYSTRDMNDNKLTRECSAILTELSGKKSKKSNGRKVFELPSIQPEYRGKYEMD